MRTPRPEHWQTIFGLWSIQGIAALVWLMAIPTDTENPVALGFSSARLVLIGMTIVLIAGSALARFQSRRSKSLQNWLHRNIHAATGDLLYLVSLSTIIIFSLFTTAIPLFRSDSIYPVFASRVFPVALWFGICGLELALFIACTRHENVKYLFAALTPIWKKTLTLLIIISLLGIGIVITKIGLTVMDNWGDPPVPFLEWQVLLALIFIGFFAFFPNLLSKESHTLIPLGTYVFTAILWLSQPINTAYLATPPRAPNFEIYPFSDPQFYAEYAQSALTGNGFRWPEIPARPFYVAFLTWLHLLGDQSYPHIIVLQTLVLAAFPVLLYLVGKELGGKPVGLGLAVLAAFRDISSNVAAPFASNVTNSKLFLSELPTALLITLVVWLSLRWLRSTTRPIWIPLLIGGVLGAASLIRLQSSILIVPILLIAFFVMQDRKQWLRGSLVTMGSFIVVIAPWLLRNSFAGGGFVLDNPISQTMTMARRWSGSTGNEILPRRPGENDARYSSRLTQMAIASLKQNPEFVLRSAANHFVNNEIASLLAFPARDEILSPAEFWMPRHAFWKTPLTKTQTPFLLSYVLLFCIGVAAAWHHHGLVGLLPLALGLVYNFWTALFFSSGERFIFPLDWSIHLYEWFGLLILAALVLSVANGARGATTNWLQALSSESVLAAESPALAHRRIRASLMFVLFLSAFLPTTEFIFPQKYPPQPAAEIAQRIGATAEEGEIVLYGRAIYPRYYESGEGEPETAKLGYEVQKKARLVFFLVGPKNALVIFEMDKAPDFFPNTSDVYMIGTQMDNYFSPRVVKVVKGSQTELYLLK